jgi:hypothetical protein
MGILELDDQATQALAANRKGAASKNASESDVLEAQQDKSFKW